MSNMKTWTSVSWCHTCDKPQHYRAVVDADDLATGSACCEATCEECGTQKHFIYYGNGVAATGSACCEAT